MAYDSVNHKIVMFGGYDVNYAYLNDTWLWDGAADSGKGTWTKVCTNAATCTPPAARSQPTLAYDAVRQRTVLFGGVGATGPLSDVAEWNGTTWLYPTATGAPPIPQGMPYRMYFDDQNHRSYVFDGDDTGMPTQAWDGAAWSQLPTVADPFFGLPVYRTYFSFAFAGNQKQGMMTSGFVRPQTTNVDAWYLASSVEMKPTHVLQTSVPPKANVQTVSGTWTGGASGFGGAACAQQNGVQLLLWSNGEFNQIASNSASVAAPATMSFTTRGQSPWTSLGPNLRPSLATGANGALYLAAVAPPSGCGASAGSIRTDNLSVTISYTLP
jgi:hypothetical protein